MTAAPLKSGLRIERQLPLFGELAMSKRAPQETIGPRIVRLRRDKGLTQTELAQLPGVSQPGVSGYEREAIGLDGARTIDAFLAKDS